MLLDLKLRGINISEGMTFYEREYNRVYVRLLTPSWMIFGGGFAISPFSRSAKRLLDVSLVLAGLLVAGPAVLLAAVLVKLTSKGPAFYSQVRAGRHGREFKMWKLRSMRVDAEADGVPKFASERDPRVTAVGRFIRKTRLDELPQLMNVLRGDMSLVGPRPERPYFVAQLAAGGEFNSQVISIT